MQSGMEANDNSCVKIRRVEDSSKLTTSKYQTGKLVSQSSGAHIQINHHSITIKFCIRSDRFSTLSIKRTTAGITECIE